MHVVVTLCRPTDAHFYQPVVAAVAERGHDVSVFVRDDDGLTRFLDANGIDYEVLAPVGRTPPSRLWTQAFFEARLAARLRGRNPDVLTGIGGVTAAHLSSLLGARSVVFADAETAPDPRLVRRFADEIHTPSAFDGTFGSIHWRYDGYHELAYLHPRRFDPDPASVRNVDIDPNAPFFLLEVGESDEVDGFSAEGRTTLASYLSTYGTVHALGEGRVDRELVSSRLDAADPALHDVLAFADLYVGTDATRATEAALLGTPAVRLNPGGGPDSAHLEELEARGLLDRYSREADAIRRVRELVPNPAARSVWRQRRDTLVASKVDVARYAADAICAAGTGQPDGTRSSPIPGELGGTGDL